MRAILVSVDYADLLAVTLPYNRHHFDEVTIVTTPSDTATRELAAAHDARIYATDAFYDDGATFNKWKALEQGLDAMGRDGWICLMDADVLWPNSLPLGFCLEAGRLYTPLRRMFTDLTAAIPPESDWKKYPIHKNVAEWAGYSQMFHADDPALGPVPWHEIDWKHAGGADSFFQRKWKPQNKIRPGFEVLHLGPAGENWCGRVTPYLDGTQHAEVTARRAAVANIWTTRRRNGNFDEEKLT